MSFAESLTDTDIRHHAIYTVILQAALKMFFFIP